MYAATASNSRSGAARPSARASASYASVQARRAYASRPRSSSETAAIGRSLSPVNRQADVRGPVTGVAGVESQAVLRACTGREPEHETDASRRLEGQVQCTVADRSGASEAAAVKQRCVEPSSTANRDGDVGRVAQLERCRDPPAVHVHTGQPGGERRACVELEARQESPDER